MDDFSRIEPIVLQVGDGRSYDMGRIVATFKADGDKVANRVSVSEWWLDANTKGIGAHSHPNEIELFYVLFGSMTFLVGGAWSEVRKGGFVFVPAGVQHDFENRSRHRAGVLNVFLPGAFEGNMPSIVEWFAANPAGDAL